MPVITIEAAKLDDIEKKRQLVKRITDVASEVYGIPKDKFIILIKENPLGHKLPPPRFGTRQRLAPDGRTGRALPEPAHELRSFS